MRARSLLPIPALALCLAGVTAATAARAEAGSLA
jgi:hypothetical protein